MSVESISRDAAVKRVVFLTDLEVESLGTRKGGRAFYNTIGVYIANGWDVHIITSRGGVPAEFRDKVHVYEQHFSSDFVSHPSRWHRLVGRYKYYLQVERYYARMLNAIDNGRPCVVYAYEVAGVQVAKCWARRRGYPVVSRFQGTWHATTNYSIVNRLRFYPHLQALHAKVDLVIMTNDGTQGNQALRHCKNHSSSIQFWLNGVNLPAEEVLASRDALRANLHFSEKIVFLTVSRLEQWKRVDRAISAFARMANDFPSAELHICGDGTSRSSLEALAKELGVEGRVVFHGAIAQEQVTNFMVATDVFLSLYDLSNVGNPLLEAMGSKAAIITINNGDTGSFIQDGKTGILLPDADVSRIASSMSLLASDASLRRQLGQGARQYATAHFWSWAERMQAEEALVAKLLSSAISKNMLEVG